MESWNAIASIATPTTGKQLRGFLVKLQSTGTVNPATLLPPTNKLEEALHNCLEVINLVFSSHLDLKDVALPCTD
ncbi:hypothetical protein AAY473_031701 [Plecturocebus cupreus]